MTDVYGTNQNNSIEASRDDLTKIKGIGKTTAEKLYNARITTVRRIVEMTPERLAETPSIGLATTVKFINAAKDCLGDSQQEELVIEPPKIQERIATESTPKPIEQFEVAEVIVNEPEILPPNLKSKLRKNLKGGFPILIVILT